MSEDLPLAVQMAMLEKTHRQAVQDLMDADISDVQRVVKVLALEAEHLGIMTRLRAAWESAPSQQQDDTTANPS